MKEQKKEELKLQLLKIALNDAKLRQKVYEKDLGIVLKTIGFEENISLDKISLRPKKMTKTKKSYGSLENDRRYGDDLAFGEHLYHGFVKIKYFGYKESPRELIL